MTRENQSKLLGEFYAEKKNVLKLKGEDYANETDVLQNFKSAGANIGISAELQCLSLIATKVARLGNLLSGKTPNNESISDSILDLSNYTDLLYCIVNEQITDVVSSEQKKNLVEIMNADEKDRLYNIKPNNLLDEKYKQFQPLTPEECTEPIKEPYEPKVGDRFQKGNWIWEITELSETHCNFCTENDTEDFLCDLNSFRVHIRTGVLKKLDSFSNYAMKVGDKFVDKDGCTYKVVATDNSFIHLSFKSGAGLLFTKLTIKELHRRFIKNGLRKIN